MIGFRLWVLSVSLLVVALSFFGCETPSDPRCPFVTESLPGDKTPDLSRCCEVLNECCAQIPDDFKSSDGALDRATCFKRIDQGAYLTCQIESQTLLSNRRCKKAGSS